MLHSENAPPDTYAVQKLLPWRGAPSFKEKVLIKSLQKLQKWLIVRKFWIYQAWIQPKRIWTYAQQSEGAAAHMQGIIWICVYSERCSLGCCQGRNFSDLFGIWTCQLPSSASYSIRLEKNSIWSTALSPNARVPNVLQERQQSPHIYKQSGCLINA